MSLLSEELFVPSSFDETILQSSSTVASMECPYCHTRVLSGQFCSECGYELCMIGELGSPSLTLSSHLSSTFGNHLWEESPLSYSIEDSFHVSSSSLGAVLLSPKPPANFDNEKSLSMDLLGDCDPVSISSFSSPFLSEYSISSSPTGILSNEGRPSLKPAETMGLLRLSEIDRSADPLLSLPLDESSSSLLPPLFAEPRSSLASGFPHHARANSFAVTSESHSLRAVNRRNSVSFCEDSRLSPHAPLFSPRGDQFATGCQTRGDGA